MLAGARAASASRCEQRLRLPRSVRLRRRAEFQRVYEQGFRAGGRFIVVFVRQREGGVSSGVRFGVAASRRVGNAVVRNRCKRRLRELFRTDASVFEGCRVDVVINARHGCGDARWSELQREYRRCVSKLMERLASP